MISVLVVKDGEVINEQIMIEINVCENMDGISVNIFCVKNFGGNFNFFCGIKEIEFKF